MREPRLELIFDAYELGLILHFMWLLPGSIGVGEFACMEIIAPNGEELANGVAAVGAFIRRILSPRSWYA